MTVFDADIVVVAPVKPTNKPQDKKPVITIAEQLKKLIGLVSSPL